MSDLRKSAEMALERLERTIAYSNDEMAKIDAAKHALRQALAQPQEWKHCRHCGFQYRPPKEDKWHPLAQPEQKPVAWMHELADGHRHCVTKDESGYVDNFTDTYKTIPLYTAPPKREWQGLTDEEFEQAVDGLEDLRDCWTQIEAKLKEKNT